MIKVAIVGFGKIAETTHLPAFDLVPGFEVVGIVETVPARKEAARAARPGVAVASTLAELGRAVDLVDVCTPPHYHFPACVEALERGTHVLCEKPLVTRLEEMEALWQRVHARADGPLLFCMHNWKYGQVVMTLRRLVSSGLIGRIRRVELDTLRTQPAAGAAAPGQAVDWRLDPEKAGGGILFDHGWHMLSIGLALLGGPAPRAVQARLEQRRWKDAQVEDTVECEIELDGGASMRLFATWAASVRDNRGRVVGDRGEIELRADGWELRVEGEPPRSFESEESLAGGGYRPTWNAGVLGDVLSEIEGRAPRLANLREARDCLRILRAGYESAARGSRVTLG